MEQRERFSSRLGFILISAGCAIGLGNVWRFPYITGQYGGGVFVLIYLFFLIAMGLPVVVMEFAMGRASQKSITKSYDVLEPKGTKWHIHKYFAFGGNYLLMMFYTTVGGWMLAYFVKMLKGDFVGADSAQIAQTFSDLTSNRNEMIFWMVLISVLGLLVCSLGLEKGVEKITKPMMLCLFGILLVLIVRAVTLPNAAEGLSFYLKPDISKVKEAGLGQVLFAAMGQSFFTLSIGIGSLSIFGSYLGKERSLTGEAVNVMVLDTAVAIMSGLIIFPACFAFGINPGEGPGLVFVTLPNVFNAMAGGRFWGTLFFLFMTFAAFSTVIAVFQNIIACARDLWGWSLKKSILINGGLLIVLSLPCILGMTDWLPACGQILGTQANGSIRDIQWLEDFIVSNNLLPLGAVVYLLFCTTRYGWGWKNFVEEANTGTGMKFWTAKAYRIYLTFILPVVILYITAQAYLTLFK
jgi:NSS family neurotransmitter:Na+ symporter